jgi:hypothetical protein
MKTADLDPSCLVSLWVGQMGSRQAVEDYRALRPPDDADGEPTCPFLEDIGLDPDYHEVLEVVYEPELWRRGAEAFAGLSGGQRFGPGAVCLVRELGLAPFDTALMVWAYAHIDRAQPGDRSGRVRFVGTFDFLPEPGEADAG